MAHSKVLRGWKDISSYLGTSVSTAQRWEATLGLPVHRRGTPGSTIFCFPEELDSWLRQSAIRPSLPALPARPALLLIDLGKRTPSASLACDQTKYEVLFAFTVPEAASVAERNDIAAFIIAADPERLQSVDLFHAFAHTHPSTPIAIVRNFANHSSTKIAITDPVRPDERCRIVVSVPFV